MGVNKLMSSVCSINKPYNAHTIQTGSDSRVYMSGCGPHLHDDTSMDDVSISASISYSLINKMTFNVTKLNISQRIQNICITFIQRRPNVFDVRPKLYNCYTNVLCFLGCVSEIQQFNIFFTTTVDNN